MIELPWQIVAAAIGSFTLITIVMAYTIRDKAERDHQRREQDGRLIQKAIYEGIKQGFEISQQLHKQAHEQSICHYRKHLSSNTSDKPVGPGSVS